MNESAYEGGGASRTTDPAAGSSAATDVSLRELVEAMRAADLRFDHERDRRLTEVAAERDRRLTEVAVEREKALKIKEEADKAALGLAREIQTYKDEKANELREQINSERGLYATKDDVVSAVEKVEATMKPLSDYVTSQSGPRAITGTTIGAVLAAVVLLVGLYFTLRGAQTPVVVPPVTVTVPTTSSP